MQRTRIFYADLLYCFILMFYFPFSIFLFCLHICLHIALGTSFWLCTQALLLGSKVLVVPGIKLVSRVQSKRPTWIAISIPHAYFFLNHLKMHQCGVCLHEYFIVYIWRKWLKSALSINVGMNFSSVLWVLKDCKDLQLKRLEISLLVKKKVGSKCITLGLFQDG